jgi:hypothetical protein
MRIVGEQAKTTQRFEGRIYSYNESRESFWVYDLTKDGKKTEKGRNASKENN